MTDPIKVAVLGMAHDHLWGNLKELADQEGALLVGGADPNPVLQDRFRERTGCDQVYGEYEALLDAQTPDAVFVFSATAHHAPIVELCAARGIHVMVEKPMAATLEQADRMLTAAQRHQICLMVNWPTAWSRPLHTAHRLVRRRGHWAIVAAHLARRPLRPRRVGLLRRILRLPLRSPAQRGRGLQRLQRVRCQPMRPLFGPAAQRGGHGRPLAQDPFAG